MNLKVMIDDASETLEDVASFQLTENELKVQHNKKPEEVFELRSNDGIGTKDWNLVTLIATRISLKI